MMILLIKFEGATVLAGKMSFDAGRYGNSTGVSGNALLRKVDRLFPLRRAQLVARILEMESTDEQYT